MLISYFLGQKKYPVPYDLKAVGKFVALTAVFYCIYSFALEASPVWCRLTGGTVLLAAYACIAGREIKTSKAI